MIMIYPYKCTASTAPCPATALTSSKYHNCVKNKMGSTSYLMSIYIFVRLQEKLWKHFQVIERAHLYNFDHYWQCSKGSNSKSRLFKVMVLVFNKSCFANCIMVIYICIQFQENISRVIKLQSGQKYITQITFFKVQRTITPIVD